MAVVRNSGTTIEGRLTAIDPGTLGIDGVTLESASIIRVDRVGDPIWNGLAIGAAFGALVAIPSRPTLAGGTVTAAIFSAIGGTIDQAIVGRKTVYGGAHANGGRTVRVLPIIDRHQQAVALSVAF